jgi:hypothetical protein
MSEILLGGLLMLMVAWLVLRIRQNKAAEKSGRQKKVQTSGAFHAVAIKYTENACDAAKQLTGRRFLSSAAPRLPLPECNHLECRCSFAHYKDRRSAHDRRSPFARSSVTGATGVHQQERRARADRRREDDDDFSNF